MVQLVGTVIIAFTLLSAVGTSWYTHELMSYARKRSPRRAGVGERG
jgi:hypothetical protein